MVNFETKMSCFSHQGFFVWWWWKRGRGCGILPTDVGYAMKVGGGGGAGKKTHQIIGGLPKNAREKI